MPKQKKSHKQEPNTRKDYDWFIKADVSKYAGRWVAVQNQKIVASDNRIGKLLDEVNRDWPSASITKIPKRGQIMVL